MIQRIQTLYFLIAALTFGVLFMLPLASSMAVQIPVFADQVFTIQEAPLLMIQALAGALVALVAILLYKNRPLQIRLGYLLILQAIALPVVTFVLLSDMIPTVEASAQVHYKAGFFLPAGTILLVVLAILSIRKDEHLVKSMDRLR